MAVDLRPWLIIATTQTVITAFVKFTSIIKREHPDQRFGAGTFYWAVLRKVVR